MFDLNALGLDGMPALFFKKNWDTVNKTFTNAIQHFFLTGNLLGQWTFTFISLIPKIQGANTFEDFSPISLTNVYYKIVTKTIANRLKPAFEKIMSPN